MTNLLKTLSCILLTSLPLLAEEDSKPREKEKSGKPLEIKEPVTKEGKVTIAGQEISYTATTAKTVIRNKKGEPQASVFHTSYVRTGVKEPSERPVMFAFNGGPGSSAVWLHLGILGPKRIDFPGDGTQPIVPPARLINNESSLLDLCDLVFIDPVSTGYSRAEKDADEKDFHGLESDIESVGDFIRIWTTQNKRWSSPKYLCGESYGGIRAAGLAEHLQNRYGMSLNGVVLLSSLLDFRTIIPSDGSQLSYQVYLPAFATTAHFHGKVEGDRNELLEEAKQFAFGEYGQALMKGNAIGKDELAAIAKRLSELTGISGKKWISEKLRLDPTEFRAELLREEGKVIGRFDARVAWPATDAGAERADYDPSYSLAVGAFSTAMLSYLGEDLGWTEDQPYEILTSVWPWDYGAGNRIVNLTDRLSSAIRDNPELKILVMGAYTDLATPPEGVEYSFRQALGLPEPWRKNVNFTYYEAGHMFYLNPPDLKKARKDLASFLGGAD